MEEEEEGIELKMDWEGRREWEKRTEEEENRRREEYSIIV
jgi:hypothetical protein